MLRKRALVSTEDVRMSAAARNWAATSVSNLGPTQARLACCADAKRPGVARRGLHHRVCMLLCRVV